MMPNVPRWKQRGEFLLAPRIVGGAIASVRWLLPIGFVLVGLEVASRGGILAAIFFPPPSAIFRDGIHALFEPPRGFDNTLMFHAGRSIVRASLGWAIGSISGAIVGLLVGWRVGLVGRTANSLIEVLRPVPAIVLLPVLVIILGLNDISRIAVIAWACFVLVAINGIYGASVAARSLLVQVARVFGASEARVFSSVVFKGALPQIMAGVSQTIGIALIMAIAVELVLGSDGLGWLVNHSRRIFASTIMYGGIICVGILGLLMATAFQRFSKFVLREYP